MTKKTSTSRDAHTARRKARENVRRFRLKRDRVEFTLPSGLLAELRQSCEEHGMTLPRWFRISVAEMLGREFE